MPPGCSRPPATRAHANHELVVRVLPGQMGDPPRERGQPGPGPVREERSLSALSEKNPQIIFDHEFDKFMVKNYIKNGSSPNENPNGFS